MSYTFHEGLPEELNLKFDCGIFHDSKHLMLQRADGWSSFYIKQNDSVSAIIHLNIADQQALSPYRSPYGSYLFSEKVDENVLIEFIQFCEKKLMSKNASEVQIKNFPVGYSIEKSEVLLRAFQKLGYQIVSEETSALISITDKPFEAGLHKSEKKRLRKCRESELRFEILPLEQLQKIYTFLEACRLEKGYSLSMTFEEINKLSYTFPERVMLTSVVYKNQLAAANISIRVFDHVLYNFYHDHASEYDQLSPVVLLNEGLYQFCQQHKIDLLDLGTSNMDGKVNESLLNFKLNLGAQPSRKLTFTKTLA